jgi:hypothetical protein
MNRTVAEATSDRMVLLATAAEPQPLGETLTTAASAFAQSGSGAAAGLSGVEPATNSCHVRRGRFGLPAGPGDR